MGNSDVRKLKDMLCGIVEGFGYECVGIDVNASSRSSAAVLRIFIDTPGGVKHEDCERVSRAVGEYLDGSEEDGVVWFDGKYRVEVSSPGLERPLFTPDHYRRFAGKPVAIRIKSGKSGKKISGKIESVGTDNSVSLALDDDSIVEVPFDEIKSANLIFSIEKGEKNPGGKAPGVKKSAAAKAKKNRAG